MAHRREIYTPRCDCGKKATVEVFDVRNEPYGPRCTPCGARLVKCLNAEETKRAIPTKGENR